MKEFRKVLKSWVDEMSFDRPKLADGVTPNMGKFESEELWREAVKWLEQPEQAEPVVLESLKRVGALEVRERIYGTSETPQRSVLQDWTQSISTRQQGVLIIALRGPDGVRKEDAAKPIVRTLRGMVMNAGRTGAPVGNAVWKDDPFMTLQWINSEHQWTAATRNFFDAWDSYNVHFLQHLMHAFGVAGIHYPEISTRMRAWAFYVRCCQKLHLPPESKDLMQYRLRDGIREEDGKGD